MRSQWSVVVMLVVGSCLAVAEEPRRRAGGVTQGEFAQLLHASLARPAAGTSEYAVFATGRTRGPADTPATQALDYLAEAGLEPPGGWRAAELVRKIDLARLVVQLHGAENIVDLADGEACVAFAEAKGAPMGSLGDFLKYMQEVKKGLFKDGLYPAGLHPPVIGGTTEKLTVTRETVFRDEQGRPAVTVLPGTRILGWRDTNAQQVVMGRRLKAELSSVILDDGGPDPGEWIMSHRLHPAPGQLPDFLQRISREGLLRNSNNVAQAITFVACVVRDNPDVLSSVRSAVESLPVVDQKHVCQALWEADTPEASAVLADLLRRGPVRAEDLAFNPETNPPDLLEEPLGGKVLDRLWSAFFATGDSRYISRIVEALPLLADPGDHARRGAGGVARWSLKANCRQSGDVLRICESLSAQTGIGRAELGAILQEVKKPSPAP